MAETISKKGESFLDLLKFIILLVIIIVPFRMYIAQPFIVNGASMEPTFKQGDYLIVDELSYLLREPERGEVIIFRNPEDSSQYFIKRVIGLPDEKILVNGKSVTITQIDGEEFVLEQPFVENASNRSAEIILGSEEYFVMGDNRAVSYDSRMWGPLKLDLIKGRAFARLFPPKKIGLLPGNFQYAI